MSRDPNRNERLTPLNPVERNLKPCGTGDMASDGYVRTGRRPRGFDEIVSEDRAARIDDIINEYPYLDDNS